MLYRLFIPTDPDSRTLGDDEMPSVAAVDRIAQRETLIEVDHEFDVIACGTAHLSNGLQIIGKPVSSETQLESCEATFFQQFTRLLRKRGGIREPQAVAVIGRHKTCRASEEDGKRLLRPFSVEG